MSAGDVNTDLNGIFVEIGEFGPHQMVIFFLLSILNMATGAAFTIYMISSNTLDYR